MHTIPIRRGLAITLRTQPGSGRIQWWIDDPQAAVMFDPGDSTFRSSGDSGAAVELILNLSPRDQNRIKRQLLKYAKARRKRFEEIRKLCSVIVAAA